VTFIYCINITASVLLLFWPVWFARTQLRLPWINPLSIILMTALPVDLMVIFGGPLSLIEEGLFDIGYQYALLMTNVLMLAQASGAFFFFRLSKSVGAHLYMPFQQVLFESRDFRYSSRFFLMVFVFALFMLASAEFGVLNWLLNPREGYQLYRAGQGHWYALANSAIAVSFVLAFLARPTVGNLLYITAFYLGLGYLLGTKGVLLAIFTTTIVFFWFLRWRHLGKLVLVGMPLVFGLMTLNLYLAFGDGMELQSIVAYFDHFKNGADYYRGYLNHEVGLFHGEVVMSSLWAYVPRSLWPDKPWAYGITLVNEVFYPGQAELTHTPAFGGAVEQFADFGPLGVVLFGFFSSKAILTGLLSYLIFRKPGLRFDRVTLSTVMLILVQYAPAFGNFLPTGLYLLQLFVILVLLRLLFRSHRRIVPPTPYLLRNEVSSDYKAVQ
jgi:hypothetical protein